MKPTKFQAEYTYARMRLDDAEKERDEAVRACKIALAFIEGRLRSESVAHRALLEVVRAAESRKGRKL